MDHDVVIPSETCKDSTIAYEARMTSRNKRKISRGLLVLTHCMACRSSSLTAPNGPSQRALVGIALDFAEASPREVGYVAIHGTGTPLGDPIEVGALSGALSNHERPLSLGLSR